MGGPTARCYSALNKEVTRLTGQKPVETIKEKTVPSKPSTPYLRPVGVNEKKLPSGLSVRYLYQPGELEGGRRRATDPIWSLKVYEIEKIMIKPNSPVIYYLFDGPKRWFVREELLVLLLRHLFCAKLLFFSLRFVDEITF